MKKLTCSLLLSVLTFAMAGDSQALASGWYSVGPAGSPGGSEFANECSSGTLVGLTVYAGMYVDSVQMICDDGSGGRKSEGPHYGGGGGSQRKLACGPGFAVGGIFGHDGWYLDRLGIYCVSKDYPSLSYSVSSVGGSGGTPYSYSCSSGDYAKGIFGSSGSLVDTLGLKCVSNPSQLGCDPWGDDCGANEMCQLEECEGCGDGETRGQCVSTQILCPNNVDPVCGCDGETYTNACYARQAGQNVWYQGSCW